MAWIKKFGWKNPIRKDGSIIIHKLGWIQLKDQEVIKSPRLNSRKLKKYRDTCIRITRYQFFRFSSDSKNIFFHEDFYQYRLLKGGVNTYELHLENHEIKSDLGTIPKCNAVCQLNSERRFKFFLSLENQNMSAEIVEMRELRKFLDPQTREFGLRKFIREENKIPMIVCNPVISH